jgi:predicted enzyme related to lactoylglutathione lyase
MSVLWPHEVYLGMPGKFLSAFILKCEDPKPLADFYKQALGLPLEQRGAEFSCMLGATHFAIHKGAATENLELGITHFAIHKGAATENLELGIYIEDLEEFVSRLESRKIPIVDPIKQYPWARSARIKDPLGNIIYLMELPASSIIHIGQQLAKDFPVSK